MYEQFLADPAAVDSSWHDFFADYHLPGDNGAAPHTAKERTAAPVLAPHQHQHDATTPLRGAAARVVANMETSLELPTATSVRAVPAKLLVDNRIVINNHLRRTRGGKVSFTHLIGYAVVRALADHPQMNRHYTTDDQGKPAMVAPEHVNLGLAIDLKTAKGRSLVVASIKGCEVMTFAQFWQAYEDVIRKAREGKLTAEDLAATTISLTNPGTIGTNHSVPRLMSGQGAIIGVGAMEYPAAFQGASDQALADMAISKIITLTSTYDHRIIQGAESGEFLRRVHGLLLGEDGFYDGIFASLRIPYEPVRWVQERVAKGHAKPSRAEQKYILSKLNAAESFETFLQTKYVGQKRFSLEGAETVIPLLDAVLDKAAEYGLDEVVLGMPHRGRLNVLANVVGKPYSQIFREYEGNVDPGQAHGSGDVKYHLGAEGKYYRMF